MSGPADPASVLDSLVAAVESRIFPSGGAGPRDPSDFAARLRRPIGAPIRVIAEVKRASPSQGAIRPEADAVGVAAAYARDGAAAISVLTEPTRFGGSFDDLRAVSAAVGSPTLCKDFVVTDEQLRAAAVCGARAVLLMVRVVGSRLAGMVRGARQLGLEPLVEIHEAAELEAAVHSGARVIGVNNRDLGTLRIDRVAGEALLARVPRRFVRVAESGYESADDVRHLDADAVLVGTALMRNPGWLGTVSAWRAPARPRVKICGLTRVSDAALAAQLGADALGFVVSPGLSRSVDPLHVPHLAGAAGHKAVLVFRAPTIDEVRAAVDRSGVDRVQLHRADERVVDACSTFASVTEAVDAPRAGTALRPTLCDVGGGASGRTLGWDQPHFGGFAAFGGQAPPWAWIAGGITPENLPSLLSFRPFGIDLSSGVESAPGVKDPARLRALFAALPSGGEAP